MKHVRTPLIAAALALPFAFALAGCERGDADTTVGEKLDHAVAKTEQSLATAGEKTRETLHENAPAVEEKLSAAGHEIKAATERTVDRTKDAVHGMEDRAAADGAAKAGSDAWITTSIKADLVKDPDLSALKIDVDTRDGVVTLNGLAPDADAKQRAERMAASVKGVREVRNHLTVKQG